MHGSQKHTRLSGRIAGPLLLIGLVAWLVAGLGACSELPSGGTGTATTGTALDTTSTAPMSIDSTTTTVPNPVSQESRDYATWLGGTSHKGEKLYFVIGASVKSEAQAKALLEPAKAVGDMQSNFIVQLSDNFAGMTPGYWVIFEAYDGYPSDDDLFFCRRPFPTAYVKTATVLTDDPIPVRSGQ